MSGEGSKYFGKGFIHLTGKEQYETISDAWNKDPKNSVKKHFDKEDIDELTTNRETALKASMYYWTIDKKIEIDKFTKNRQW